jgi:hypothetical protein
MIRIEASCFDIIFLLDPAVDHRHINCLIIAKVYVSVRKYSQESL